MMKTVFDFIFSITLWFILSPLMIVIVILVMIFIGRPVFFKQKRPGLLGRPFKIVKFRTMENKHEDSGNLLTDCKRITKFGELLRSTSLDELPELYNVVKGEMSIVGPRPLLMEYIDYYTEEQFQRHTVKPGITGWAQINGRNAINWDKKFALDLWYVQNQTFRLDINIIARTISQAIRRENINQPGHTTAEKFKPDRIVVRQ